MAASGLSPGEPEPRTHRYCSCPPHISVGSLSMLLLVNEVSQESQGLGSSDSLALLAVLLWVDPFA